MSTQNADAGETWIETPAPSGGTWLMLARGKDVLVIAPPAVALHEAEPPDRLCHWRIACWPLDDEGWLVYDASLRETETVTARTAEVLALLPTTRRQWVQDVMRSQLDQCAAFAIPRAGEPADEERSPSKSAQRLVGLRAELQATFPARDWHTSLMVPSVPDTDTALLGAIDGIGSTIQEAVAANDDYVVRRPVGRRPSSRRAGTRRIRAASSRSRLRARTTRRPRQGSGRSLVMLGVCAALSIGAVLGFSARSTPPDARAKLVEKLHVQRASAKQALGAVSYADAYSSDAWLRVGDTVDSVADSRWTADVLLDESWSLDPDTGFRVGRETRDAGLSRRVSRRDLRGSKQGAIGKNHRLVLYADTSLSDSVWLRADYASDLTPLANVAPPAAGSDSADLARPLVLKVPRNRATLRGLAAGAEHPIDISVQKVIRTYGIGLPPSTNFGDRTTAASHTTGTPAGLQRTDIRWPAAEANRAANGGAF